MKKRILSMLLVLVMVIGMLPTVAFAADGTSDYTITFDKNGVTSGYREVYDTPLTMGSGESTVAVAKTYVLSFTEDNFTMQNDTGYIISTKIGLYNVSGELSSTAKNIPKNNSRTGAEITEWNQGFTFNDSSALTSIGYPTDKIDSAAIKYYFLCFKRVGTASKGEDVDFAVLIEITPNGTAPAAPLTDEEKAPLTVLLNTVTGENETNWYQSGDRYNGTPADTITNQNSGFWKEFTAANGPRAHAQSVLESATTVDEINAAVQELQTAIDKLIPTSQVNATELYEVLNADWVFRYGEVVDRMSGRGDKNSPNADADNTTTVTWEPYAAAKAEAEALLKSLYDENGNATAANTADKQSEVDRLTAAADPRGKLVHKDTYTEKYQTYMSRRPEAEALLAQYDPAKLTASDYSDASWAAYTEAYDALEKDMKHTVVGGTVEDYEMLTGFIGHIDALRTVRKQLESVVDVTVSVTYLNAYAARLPEDYDHGSYTDIAVEQDLTLEGGKATLLGLYDSLPISLDFNAIANNAWLPNTWDDNCDTMPLFAIYINGESYGTLTANELVYGDAIQLHDGDHVVMVRIMTLMSKGEASSGYDSTTITKKKAQAWEYQHSFGIIDMTAPSGTVKVGDKAGFSATVTGADATNMGEALSPKDISLFVSAAGDTEAMAQYVDKTTALTDANGKLEYVFTEPGWYTVAMMNVQDDVYTFTDVFNATTYGEYYSLYAGDCAMVYVAPADDDDAVIAQYRTENLAKAKTYFEQFHDYDFAADYYDSTFKTQYDALIANQNSAETFTELMAKFDEDYVKLQEYGATAIDHDELLTGLREDLSYIPADLNTMDARYKDVLTEIQTVYGGLNEHQKSLLTGNEISLLDQLAAIDASGLAALASVTVNFAVDGTLPSKIGNGNPYYGWPNLTWVTTPLLDGTVPTPQWDKLSDTQPVSAKAGDHVFVRRYLETTDNAYWMMWSVDDGATWNESTHQTLITPDEARTPYSGYYLVDYTVPKDAADGATYTIKLKMFSKTEYESWLAAKDADSIAEVRAAAIAALEAAYEGYDKSKYDEDGIAALELALENGKTAINAANTNTAVNDARKAALAAMASVPRKTTGEQKPTVAFDSGDTVGQVHVIIENQTYSSGLNKLDGVYVNDWFDLGENDTMMTVVLKALRSKGYSWNGTVGTFNPDGSMDYEGIDVSDYTITYLSSVIYGDQDNSLAEFDGGQKSGWMGTLNDWFVHEGFQGFSVANGKLENNDEIHVMYTCAYGADIDGSWNSTDTSLAELSISGGTLTPAFDGATTDYMLLISGSRANVKVQPVPSNKNYQHRIFLNNYNSDSAYYKRTETISVTSGDVIYVGVGESGWPTMNAGGRPTKYTIEVYTLADAIEALPNESAVTLSNYKSYKETASLLRSTISRQGYSGDTSKLEALEAKIQFYTEIDNVKSLLNAIPAASQLKTSDKSKVVAAQNAYEKLSEEQKLYITVADVAKYNAAVEWLDEQGIVIPGGTISGADKAPEEVTVPISGDQNSIDVAVTVDGTKATISDVDLSDLNSVIGNHVDTGTVTIDFSGLESDEAITTVEIPSETIKQIAEAVNNPNNDAHSLEIVLSDGASIEFDAAALKEKASQADGLDITISIESHENVKLTNAQKKALGDRPAFDINVTSGGKHISDMGGKITVHAPYVLKGDEKARGIVVWYVDDNGNKERCETSYDPIKKRVNWKTDHLSLYMIDYDETLANNPFTDVTEDAYYFDAVLWAVDEGITNGTSATTFSPDASCTRAQMVTFLWRAAGSPKATATTCVFTDVDKDAYYYEALLWAVENGITNGTSATTFSPDATCTRGQMATFLYRNAKSPAVSGTHAFTDVKADAYYNDAVVWAAAEGITVGTSATTFSPDTDCTRGQMVTFIYRYLAK